MPYPFFIPHSQMKYQAKSEAVLLLADGTAFYGKSVGTKGTATGEICFNTGMTGYQEIFTDPSYLEQIMVTTTAHIGNYGVHAEETESNSVKIAGLVCRNFSETFSRAGGKSTLEEYFEKNNKVAICEIDTRAVVRHVRSTGAMNAIISSETTDLEVLKKKLAEVPSMEGLELSSRVTTEKAYEYNESGDVRVAVLDLGIKTNILRCLTERGAHCKVFPKSATLAEMNEWNPDAYFLSNGPGDPSAMSQVIKETKTILETGKPVFGICLGHQIIALANGVSTYKMHHGHRGINHPILNKVSGLGEVTSQNHGFVVSEDEANAHADLEVTHSHLNDGTVAGMKMKSKPVFSVQYHPESSPGPHDSRYLFDQFISLIKEHKA